jgi:hypothetical protein
MGKLGEIFKAAGQGLMGLADSQERRKKKLGDPVDEGLDNNPNNPGTRGGIGSGFAKRSRER